MMQLFKKSNFLSKRVYYLNVDSVHPNPAQPRRYFDAEALQELSRSIVQYGVMQPLTVRKTADGYELIAGERRLRAAKLAGLREVPCIIARADEQDSSVLALIENLQRRDLHYMEEAVAIAKLISNFNLSQEEAAERLGKSQSAVANKLRLLRLSPECVGILREHALSERHARALLRIEDNELRLSVLHAVIEKSLNVAQTDAYITQLLQNNEKTPPAQRSCYVVKDVRLFLNSIRRSLSVMQRAGVAADCGREDTEDEIRLLIRIPKKDGVQTEPV